MSVFPENDKYMGDTDYFKIKEENEQYRIRILSPAIVGWINWSEDNKPTRFKPEERPRIAPNPLKPLREFTAMLIWNYDLDKVQIWEFSQKGIKKALKELDSNKGSALGYDILISKVGQGKDTRYGLKALPPSKHPNEALETLEIEPINIYALYEGKDPWTDMHAGREGLDE